jgi:hypothetical protein
LDRKCRGSPIEPNVRTLPMPMPYGPEAWVPLVGSNAGDCGAFWDQSYRKCSIGHAESD